MRVQLLRSAGSGRLLAIFAVASGSSASVASDTPTATSTATSRSPRHRGLYRQSYSTDHRRAQRVGMTG